jgi:hypothetical protein
VNAASAAKRALYSREAASPLGFRSLWSGTAVAYDEPLAMSLTGPPSEKQWCK